MHGPAILFSNMTPSPALEHEFNRWYDEEHIPLRMNVSGFRSAQRYQEPDSRNYLAVYEMDSPAVLRSPEYDTVKSRPSARTSGMLAAVTGFTRYIGELIFEGRSTPEAAFALDAPILLAVGFNVPPVRLEEFDEWHDSEHIPMLLERRDCLWSRCFQIVDAHPEPWNRLALHYLAHARALDGPELALARATPRRTRLAQEAWFRGLATRYERHGARQRGARGGGDRRR